MIGDTGEGKELFETMMDQDNYSNRDESGETAANTQHEGEATPLRKQRRPVVLKFKKRLYDGGHEAEMIKRLERRYEEMHFDENTKAANPAATPAPANRPSLRIVNPNVVQSVPEPAKPEFSKKQLVLQALFLGPLEISVSILGIITAGFAIVTFACFKNQELNQHSRTVLVECRKAFVRGIKNTIIGPGKALQHLRKSD